MTSTLRWRLATQEDVPLLARLNRELTEDEGHRNRSQSLDWFSERLHGFLQGGYTAVLFEQEGEAVAYALYRPLAEREKAIYLRQLYVVRTRRRQGLGRKALVLLRDQILSPGTRVTLEVLAHNAAARAFYATLGFEETYIGLELGE